jgi:ribonuclease HI
VRKLVIATDSEYAVEGSTNWAKNWVKDGWKKFIYDKGRRLRKMEDAKNRDLWEALLGEIETYKDRGMEIQFWRIPRDWNHLVDAAAKEAAGAEHAPNNWVEPLDIMADI